MTDSEAADRLREHFAGTGWLLDERGKKVRFARLDGKACGLCARPFDDGEAVYRLRLRKTDTSEIAPICHQCFEAYVKEWWGIKIIGVFSTEKCANCGRTVHQTELRLRAKRTFCCDACQTKHGAVFYAERARKLRADQRGPSRECSECGDHFEPHRADAQFCSNGCRQKAYRKRDRYR